LPRLRTAARPSSSLPPEPAAIIIRRATLDDVDAILSLFDEAIRWFVSMGNTKQWGTEPFSGKPERRTQVEGWCREDGAWIAEHPKLGVVGALVLGEANTYVPAAAQPELYLRLVIASRAPEAKGTGRTLMAFADAEARRHGIPNLRVDCYAGGTGRLVEFYESCGYVRTETFTVGEWPGQLLEKRLDPDSVE